ncbi:MAG: phospholipid-binding lipoprotein MlaA [Rhodothermales bacterium]|jgi:phospholipid-binding lipoprotein MlaA
MRSSYLPILIAFFLGWPLIAQDSDDDFADFADDETAQSEPLVKDPLEKLNRAVFQINDGFYTKVMKPTANGYGKVVPSRLRNGLRNVFYNVHMPVRFTNAVVQGDLAKGGTELARFAVNLTYGGLCLDDAATEMFDEPEPSPEDTGQTLARYRVGPGFYLVIPVLGPSTLRDGVGTVGDVLLDPFTYFANWPTTAAMSVAEQVNNTSFDPEAYENLKKDALDPYTFFRDAYMQNRNKKIAE